MAGHSHWKQIKHKKGTEDQKRGRVFSKLLGGVSIAARQEQNPQFNPRLRAAIQKAREFNVPQDNIERAIRRVAKEGVKFEEMLIEAYGPGNAALIIEAITDNKNRTINEIKLILKEVGAKWAESGSVRWAFEQTNELSGENWKPKFTKTISDEDKEKLKKLIQKLEDHNDIQVVYNDVIL